MKRLGKVLHISSRGSIILRVDKTPPIGSKSIVMDKQAQEIGTIVDIFGPVVNPYIVIRPRRDFNPQKLVGQMLYLQKK